MKNKTLEVILYFVGIVILFYGVSFTMKFNITNSEVDAENYEPTQHIFIDTLPMRSPYAENIHIIVEYNVEMDLKIFSSYESMELFTYERVYDSDIDEFLYKYFRFDVFSGVYSIMNYHMYSHANLLREHNIKTPYDCDEYIRKNIEYLITNEFYKHTLIGVRLNNVKLIGIEFS